MVGGGTGDSRGICAVGRRCRGFWEGGVGARCGGAVGAELVMEGVEGRVREAGKWFRGSGWGEFGVVMRCGKLLGMTPRCGNGFTASSFDS